MSALERPATNAACCKHELVKGAVGCVPCNARCWPASLAASKECGGCGTGGTERIRTLPLYLQIELRCLVSAGIVPEFCADLVWGYDPTIYRRILGDQPIRLFS